MKFASRRTNACEATTIEEETNQQLGMWVKRGENIRLRRYDTADWRGWTSVDVIGSWHGSKRDREATLIGALVCS